MNVLFTIFYYICTLDELFFQLTVPVSPAWLLQVDFAHIFKKISQIQCMHTTIISKRIHFAWENNRNFGMPTLVSARNDAWATSAEIPCWWRVTTLINASDWSYCMGNLLQPISNTQILVVTRHQYGIFALVPQTFFRGETSRGIANWWLFSRGRIQFD